MKALYIVGDSRSGSTLLQHLLALQDSVTALGEVHRLEGLVHAGELCSCGRPVDECPFWRRVAAHAGLPLEEVRTSTASPLLRRWLAQVSAWAALRYGLERPVRKLLVREQQVAANCLALYKAAGQLTGSRAVVDTSKLPAQFLHLYLTGGNLVRPVLLVRDGRAVVWSKMQRRGDLSVALIARRWLRVSRAMLALQRILPSPDRNFVYYEDLCRNPIKVLESILGRVNTTVQSTELGDLSDERHDLGGSPRFRKRRSVEIQADERWRTEMPKDALATFERIAGPMNRRLGYA
ncbi:MAG: sulfotransferase [Rubrobacteraceae bacterium]